MTMPWVWLVIAGLFEVAWAVGLKYSEGFSRPGPTAWTVCALAISLGLLGLSMRHLPVGTAYAVWTGIGTLGTVLIGMWVLGEAVSPLRLVCLGLIVLGIGGLKLAS